MNKAWTVSTREEVIAALWTIAALVAFNGGHGVIGTLLAIKAASDVLCALGTAIYEAHTPRKEDK
jgi:hypothetical protein